MRLSAGTGGVSLLDRIVERSVELDERAKLLRKELAEVEGERPAAVVSESSSTPVKVAIPNRQDAGGPQDLPADYQRLLETVTAADGPVRAATIDAFRAAHPQRFTRTPALPKLPTTAWINKPEQDSNDYTEEASA